MARIVKEYDERMNEFLDTAIELMIRKGYERTTVQDIIDAVGVSKGAFYHYFSSKEELLDALAERMAAAVIDRAWGAMEGKPADARLREFLASAWQWKSENLETTLIFLPIIYAQGNIRLKNRLIARTYALCAPPLIEVIEQGTEEGVFDVQHPAETMDLIFWMLIATQEGWVEIMKGEGSPAEKARLQRRKFGVMIDAFEKILGAQRGSLGRVPDSFIRKLSRLDITTILEVDRPISDQLADRKRRLA
jgi:AcrR family transcriptional regulator